MKFLDNAPIQISIPVSFAVGDSITSLAGATVDAWAVSRADAAAVAVAGTTAISGDTITVSWAAGDFPPGPVACQIRVTVGAAVRVLDFSTGPRPDPEMRFDVLAGIGP